MKKFFVVCGFLVCLFVASIVGNTNADENNPTEADNKNLFAAHDAIEQRDTKKAKNLISKYQHIVHIDYGMPVINLAVQHGEIEIVKTLRKYKVDMNKLDAFGKAPIHSAFLFKHFEIAKFLIDVENINIHIQTLPLKRTPLHYAAENGYLEFVNRLTEKGADLEVRDLYDNTPLHDAARNGHLKVVEFLLEKGADADIKNAKGLTPLDYATQNNHKNISVIFTQFAHKQAACKNTF